MRHPVFPGGRRASTRGSTRSPSTQRARRRLAPAKPAASALLGRFLERFGCGIAAGALPAVYLVGFAVLGFSPTLAVVLVFQVAQRWANFAIANPARQVLFTVVERGEKYKAKNFVDVVVFRGSDAVYGWAFESLQAIGLKLGVVALCALPVAAAWLALSTALGRGQERRAAGRSPDDRRA